MLAQKLKQLSKLDDITEVIEIKETFLSLTFSRTHWTMLLFWHLCRVSCAISSEQYMSGPALLPHCLLKNTRRACADLNPSSNFLFPPWLCKPPAPRHYAQHSHTNKLTKRYVRTLVSLEIASTRQKFANCTRRCGSVLTLVFKCPLIILLYF